MKKVNNKKIGFIFVIFGLIFLFFSFLFAFKSLNNSTLIDDSIPIRELADGNVNLTNVELINYYNMFNYKNIGDDMKLNLLSDNNGSIKLYLASRLVKNEEFIDIQCNLISDETINEENTICGDVILKSNWSVSNSFTKSIPKDVLERYLKHLFGINEKIEAYAFQNPFSEDLSFFVFDPKLSSFVKIEYIGDNVGNDMIETLKGAKKINDKLIISSILSSSDDSNQQFNVTLTLKWDDDSNHYIFDSRNAVKLK